MAKEQKSITEPTLVLRMEPNAPLPDPAGANFVQLAQLGSNVSLLLGWFDIHRAARRLNRATTNVDETVDLNVTHQFMISLDTFRVLHKSVNELADKMAKRASIATETLSE